MSIENLENYDDKYEYKNKAELEVTACGDTHTICSNEVEAKKVVIELVKSQTKTCVFKGDTIVYTIKICNKGKVDIHNAVFSDDIPEGLKFVNGTFTVGGETKTPSAYGNKLTYTIAKIDAEDDVTITFSATVL